MGFEVYKRPLARLLYHWREYYGLGLTPHFLVHITGMSWPELAQELRTDYGDDVIYRTLICPDVQAPVFYVDYPFVETGDYAQACVRDYQKHIFEKSERAIQDYPPDQGYVCMRNGAGQTHVSFRNEAKFKKFRHSIEIALTPEIILEDTRRVWQSVSQEIQK